MNIDPTGELFFLCLLIGLLVGAAVGATVSGVQAYNDGARGWDLLEAILEGLFIGAAIGALAGAVIGVGAVMITTGLPMISASGGLLAALAGGGTEAAVALAGVAAVGLGATVVVGGAAIAGIGLNVLFFKGSGPRMGHNQYEKQMWNEAMRQLKIKSKDLMQRLHHLNEKQPYADTLDKLLQNLREILQKINRG